MRLFLLCILLVAAGCPFFASGSPGPKVDSLLNALSMSRSDSERTLTLGHLVKATYRSDPEKATGYANDALNIARTTTSPRLIGMAFTNLGLIHLTLGKYDSSMSYLLRAEKLFKSISFRKGLSDVYTNIGSIYDDKGDYKNSIEYYLRSYHISEEDGNDYGIANSTNNIGISFAQQGEFKRAMEYFRISLVHQTRIGNIPGAGNNINNIALCHGSMKNYDSALVYLEKAVTVWKSIGDKKGMAMSYTNMGDCYRNKGELKKAENYLDMALDFCRELNDQFGMGAVLGQLSSLYLSMNRYEEGIVALKKILALAEKTGNRPQQKMAYQNLTECFRMLGDYQKALEYQTLYMQVKDSIFNTSKNNQILEMQTKYDTDKKEKENQLLAKDNLIKNAEIESGKKTRNFLIGIAVLILVLAFVLFRAVRSKQRANDIISSQKKEVEAQKELVEEKQKEILDSIYYAQRIQRAMLASDNLLGSRLGEFFVLYKPKDIVSGDFYWATVKQQEHSEQFYLAVCDSTGHGVPGAFMSLLNISFLNEAITEKSILEPCRVFDHARGRLIGHLSQEGGQDGMDGVLIALQNRNGKREARLSYAAAHNSPVVVRSKSLLELEADKMPVGRSPKEEQLFTCWEQDLLPGDMLYLFTDGFADQFGGPKGKKFKYRQLLDTFLAIADEPPAAQKKMLEDVFENWKGALEQVDDVLIIGMRI